MSSSPSVSPQLAQLATWMAGHFNNLQQAITEPVWFANIHVYQCPLPWSVLEGVGFYVEQLYDIYPEQPYRQRVLHLFESPDGIRIQNYALTAPDSYKCAGRELGKLAGLTAAGLEPLPGCITQVEWTGSSYRGQSVPGKGCIVERKGKTTYLHSEFEIGADYFHSLDQGRDPETDQVIWGSLSGPFQFVKKQDFSGYLPQWG
ncbi:MAG: chromophore lyase CpcT/CpeT [Cyanobacteriota bacterium]